MGYNEKVELNENEILMKELTGENDWKMLSRLNLSDEDLIKYKNKLDWDNVLFRHDFINLDILDQLIEEGILDLEDNNMAIRLCNHVKRSFEFIKKYKDKLTVQTIIGHCDFESRELAQLITIKPKIGMGVICVTNRNLFPYTIIKVNKAGNEIKIQKDTFELLEGYDYSNQVYNIAPDSNGEILKVTLRKNGNWGVVNSSSTVFLGSKQCYINPDAIVGGIL